jgi:hypothetical protein
MKIEPQHYFLNQEITLLKLSKLALQLPVQELVLLSKNSEIIECRLVFQVDYPLYQTIDTEALFNLKPEARSPLTGGDFLPEYDILIETSLKPDLLEGLLEKVGNAEEAANYLLNLSQNQADDPLLETESWLCLSVKQDQETKETGYKTFWSYLNPSLLSQEDVSQEQITEGLTNFFQEWSKENLSEAIGEATSEIMEGITSVFQELIDKSFSEADQDTNIGGDIFDIVVKFFEEEDWPFAKVEGESALRLTARSNNGQWTCYAQAIEEDEEFIFYSICPVNTPENKRLTMAEFLTRANYGLSLGNFELDFEDGEIRYKTSINVGGDILSKALIMNLVDINITMMDTYLPGILTVIESDVSPAEAIEQIEQNRFAQSPSWPFN